MALHLFFLRSLTPQPNAYHKDIFPINIKKRTDIADGGSTLYAGWENELGTINIKQFYVLPNVGEIGELVGQKIVFFNVLR